MNHDIACLTTETYILVHLDQGLMARRRCRNSINHLFSASPEDEIKKAVRRYISSADGQWFEELLCRAAHQELRPKIIIRVTIVSPETQR